MIPDIKQLLFKMLLTVAPQLHPPTKSGNRSQVYNPKGLLSSKATHTYKTQMQSPQQQQHSDLKVT